MSLEDPRTRERYGFCDMASLVMFLEQQLRKQQDAGSDASMIERSLTMHTTVDLTQGLWRFHTALGLISLDELKRNPAQPNGPNSDVVFSFVPHSEPLNLSEGVALSGVWLRNVIHPEDPWDNEASKGKFYVKVFPAVPAVSPGHQIIQIYQTEYRWTTGDYTGDLTIYTGRLYQPLSPAGQPTPPVFFGYGADNAGRQWLTFSLAPSNVHV
jgi:hypothetical protein